jgi:hypothetical protein
MNPTVGWLRVRKTLALVCPLLIGLMVTGCGLSVVNGSGQIVSEERPVSGFDAVTLAGSGDLIITQGSTESLTIEADDNILPHIRSEVRSGTLVIEYDRDNWDTVYRPSRTIRYDLMVKDLNSVIVSGSGNVQTASLTSNHLDLTVSGSGDVHIDNLQTDSLIYLLSGSGGADLAGRTGDQQVTISGSGSYRAGDLQSASARVSISGSGDVTVWADDSLDARISGSGSVGYFGNPQVSSDVAGSGQVTSLGDK